MQFGVIRVVDAEILWLTCGGKFRELGPLTWRADRETAFLRARRARGLVVRVPSEVKLPVASAQKKDPGQRVFRVIDGQAGRETKASSADFSQMAQQLRQFRQRSLGAP